MKRSLSCSIPLLILLSCTARASSDDAWNDFREEVRTSCVEAVRETLESPLAVVDPFGSESFGLALVSGLPKGGSERVFMICVFDKRTKSVEMGGELTAEIVIEPR